MPIFFLSVWNVSKSRVAVLLIYNITVSKHFIFKPKQYCNEDNFLRSLTVPYDRLGPTPQNAIGKILITCLNCKMAVETAIFITVCFSRKRYPRKVLARLMQKKFSSSDIRYSCHQLSRIWINTAFPEIVKVSYFGWLFIIVNNNIKWIAYIKKKKYIDKTLNTTFLLMYPRNILTIKYLAIQNKTFCFSIKYLSQFNTPELIASIL